MKKIPTVFERNPKGLREIRNQVHPGSEWVLDGEGVATQKYDGTCCRVLNGQLYKRRTIRSGKPQPPEFIQEDFDPNTGKYFGWLPVTDAKEDKRHREAFCIGVRFEDGTYELVGPKIQNNPEGYEDYQLLSHARATQYPDVPRTFEGLRAWLKDKDIEGLVFHHPDGRMAKVKKRDFGFSRSLTGSQREQVPPMDFEVFANECHLQNWYSKEQDNWLCGHPERAQGGEPLCKRILCPEWPANRQNLESEEI
jgi:hypothetical protein